MDPTITTTALGDVAHLDAGEGDPVLFVHGSPGGCDQGELMGRFLVAAGHRVIAPSRPGYHGTPIDDDRRTPDQQAALHVALLDALGIDRVAVACWSGGGPSTYRLAATHPDRVRAIAAVAAVSGPYTFEHPHQEGLLTNRLGHWLMGQMVKRTPKQVVKMLPPEEGDLTKAQAKELIDHIWSDDDARQFVLELSMTVTGDRKDGLRNDEQQFPAITDLGLGDVAAPVLLVHAATDSDVPVDHSEHAAAALPHADLVRIETGTHISVWTDADAAGLQARIAAHLAP